MYWSGKAYEKSNVNEKKWIFRMTNKMENLKYCSLKLITSFILLRGPFAPSSVSIEDKIEAQQSLGKMNPGIKCRNLKQLFWVGTNSFFISIDFIGSLSIDSTYWDCCALSAKKALKEWQAF